jgi:hypothetical protein
MKDALTNQVAIVAGGGSGIGEAETSPRPIFTLGLDR